jgi:multiple sugar transport system permease protein
MVNVLLAGLLAFALVPILWMIATSLKTPLQMISIPPVVVFEPTLANYQELFRAGGSSLKRIFLNSIIVSTMTGLLTLFLGGLAGFAFSRYRFRGDRLFTFGVLWTRTLPPIVAVVPLFLMLSNWGLVDTHIGLVLVYTALNLPFAIWMLKSFFDAVPVEMEEAAMVDGCTRLEACRRVTVPLAAPGMAATLIFVSVLAWNEFLFALIFSSVNAKTLPVAVVETIVEYKIYWADMAALGTIVMLPILVFSFFIQKHLVTGLTAGGIK